jgi:predicted transcriptional regulator of viral defense system
MKFNEFVKIYQEAPLIDSSTFSLYSEKPQGLRRQVREWVKKDYLIPLKRGLYIFSGEWRKIQPSVLFMANFLVLPSYVSLEYALGFYEIIPEKVTVLTSVTTKKTKIFKNLLGSFEYRSIKENLFFGFKKEIDNNQEFFIALPEKALLDYFHLNSHFQGNFSELESLRLQNLENLDTELLETYGLKYNRRTRKITQVLIEFVKKEITRYRRL